MKKLKVIILSAVGVLLISLLSVMYSPYSIVEGYKDEAFKNVLGDASIKGETLVTEIAMLGAHDAFSSNIGLSSKADPGENGIVKNGTVNSFFKGGIVRVTKAQNDNATVLLNRGVRYFDVRISYVNGEWMTKHGLLDTKLSVYIGEIYTFLKDKPDEFIIFDVQHIYLGDQSISEFLTYLASLTLVEGNLRLNDFIHYSRSTPIAELEYADVRGHSSGGIIILLNDDGSATFEQQGLFFARGDGENNVEAIRSKWHNQTSLTGLKAGISAEYTSLMEENVLPYFRVNQAQLTPDYLSDPLGTISGWSLLNIGEKSNKALVSDPMFSAWLEVMPIFMVDFANSRLGSFNKTANETMIAYNQAKFA